MGTGKDRITNKELKKAVSTVKMRRPFFLYLITSYFAFSSCNVRVGASHTVVGPQYCIGPG